MFDSIEDFLTKNGLSCDYYYELKDKLHNMYELHKQEELLKPKLPKEPYLQSFVYNKPKRSEIDEYLRKLDLYEKAYQEYREIIDKINKDCLSWITYIQEYFENKLDLLDSGYNMPELLDQLILFSQDLSYVSSYSDKLDFIFRQLILLKDLSR